MLLWILYALFHTDDVFPDVQRASSIDTDAPPQMQIMNRIPLLFSLEDTVAMFSKN